MSAPSEEPLAPVDLAPEAADRLEALVDAALSRQSAALDQAIDGGLGHLPRLLRSTVRKVLFR